MHHLESLIQAIPPAVFAAGGSVAFSSPIETQAGAVPSFPAVPPSPSVGLLPITGPSAHFGLAPRPAAPFSPGRRGSISDVGEDTSHMALYSSYLYLDDEGYTRWQGATSGLPICDLLIERHQPSPKMESRDATPPRETGAAQAENWFPDRQPSRTAPQPERIWKLITTFIPPDLMDGCARVVNICGGQVLTSGIAQAGTMLPLDVLLPPPLSPRPHLSQRMPSPSTHPAFRALILLHTGLR
jgi:hypothetical protein